MSSQLNKPTQVSFKSKHLVHGIKSYKKVLDLFKNGIEDASDLKGEIPIFIDTNVLLSYYEVSFIAREKIKQFIKSYKSRVILSAQIQYEFVKNREIVINSFQSSVTEQIPKNFKSDIINRLSIFKNENKKKLEDYSSIEKKLDKLEQTASELYDEIIKEVGNKKDIASSILLEDAFLNEVAELELLDPLEIDFIKNIKEDFHKLLPDFKEVSNGKDSYSQSVFPGCGERLEKEDPTGDFIIYHEMMAYAKTIKKDVIFLTNDTTKGDWIRKDGTAHIHYLENFYENTGQIIYILNAERVFAKLFKDVSFESLVPDENINVYLLEALKDNSKAPKLTTNSLLRFINSYPHFNIFELKLTIPKILTTELGINGIFTVEALKERLDKTKAFMVTIKFLYPKAGRVTALRYCLRILDRDYKMLRDDGTFKPLDVSKFDRLTRFLKIM